MERKLGWVAGFRFTASDWLAYPAFRLAGFQHSDWLASQHSDWLASQHSDWLAFSAPIGHNYTLIYAVMMYSSLYSYIRFHDAFFIIHTSVYNVITHFLFSRGLHHLPAPFHHDLSPFHSSPSCSPETHDPSLPPISLPLHSITNFSFPRRSDRFATQTRIDEAIVNLSPSVFPSIPSPFYSLAKDARSDRFATPT